MLNTKIKTIIQRNEFAVIAIVLVLVIVLSFGSDIFWDVNNLNSLQTSITPGAIVAFGMMLLMILGVFDLSVGSTMALVGISISSMLGKGVSVPVVILAGLGIGAVIGFVNAMLVSVVGINPLIATIGVKYMVQGLAYIKMANIYLETPEFPAAFIAIGRGKLFGIYYQFWFVFVMMLAIIIFLRFTYTGRKMYFIGSNQTAAKQMGFANKRIVIATFTFVGLLAAMAAIFSIARYGNANRYLGSGMEMTAIIACILGGASLSGGKGTPVGTVFGVIFMSLMTNFFNLFEVSSTWHNVVIGSILIVVVAMDGYLTVKKQKELGKI